MQAYEGYYENGRIVPVGNPDIPEGSRIILTVLDALRPDSTLLRQQNAVNLFLENIINCDEPLGSEFDEVIKQRFTISRELDL